MTPKPFRAQHSGRMITPLAFPPQPPNYRFDFAFFLCIPVPATSAYVRLMTTKTKSDAIPHPGACDLAALKAITWVLQLFPRVGSHCDAHEVWVGRMLRSEWGARLIGQPMKHTKKVFKNATPCNVGTKEPTQKCYY